MLETLFLQEVVQVVIIEDNLDLEWATWAFCDLLAQIELLERDSEAVAARARIVEGIIVFFEIHVVYLDFIIDVCNIVGHFNFIIINKINGKHFVSDRRSKPSRHGKREIHAGT